jgi:hypothetical protein
MKKYCLIALFCLFTFITGNASAQTATKQATVKVYGEEDVKQFKQTEVVRKDKDGNDHTFSGVVLSEILKKAGVTLGKDLKGENLTKFVSVEANDGYQVIFALAELDKDFTDRNMILATQIDGKPLAQGDGPFRIIVQDEKKPARCIKMVTGIKVQFAK